MNQLILAAMPKLVKPKYKHIHACPQCDCKTGSVSSLRTHVRTVHEQRKDHACPQCDAAFGEASNLKTHVRTVHKQAPPMPPPMPQQLGDVAPGIWSHALLNLVQPGKGNTVSLTL